MRINCIGGGPAGLYFSILFKRANPAADVTVFERNPCDETPGWGVVFSDETLGNLEEADAESYRSIRDGFIYWDAIDIHVASTTIRSGGHGFCGIERRRLLQILQTRGRELGVELRFDTPVDDPGALRDCDLLIAADGVRSRTRTVYQSHFRPQIDLGRARYIWLGTTRPFEAFTFVIRETEFGPFQVHAYQYEAGGSTFIVECDEQTFQASGLDENDEKAATRAVAQIFAPELAGHAVLPNQSRWIRFPTVKNERWHFENVVLIGDAAHTAHFSIGSGTKLAMEDAIELAAALAKQPTLSDALSTYEARRSPMVARIQRAAAQSQDWFENVRRHLRHDPERIAFSLLSRTRRITRENLSIRDARYVEQVDRWFNAGDPDAARRPAMFAPFELRGVRLPNRIVVSPMCQYMATDGTPNDWHLVHLGSRAIGGAGLVYTEMTDVSAEGRISPACTGLYREEHANAWARIVDFIHRTSAAKVAMQLGHAGRKGSTCVPWEGTDQPLPSGNWPLIAPSAIPWLPMNQVPRAMDRNDMIAVRDDFVRATRWALRAGFDWLEIHAAHGYLLSSFFSPVSNHRTDEYGGSIERRARFPLEVVDAVRDAWPDRPLSVRISATDWVEGGFTIDDAVVVSGMLKEHGVDIIDVSSGQTSPDARPIYGRAFQMPFSERIRNEVGIPTMTVGNIWTADQANTILLAGRADLVALARAHLADPYFTLHAAVAAGVDTRDSWPDPYTGAAAMAQRLFGPQLDTDLV